MSHHSSGRSPSSRRSACCSSTSSSSAAARTSPRPARWPAHLVVFIGLAVAFGIGVWIFCGGQYGGEFFAGWLTEYSLSVDNLFVFIIIMTKLQVPRQYQQTALLIGIVIALVMRGIFIGVGAAAINQFSWVFYLFGLFLVWTAYKLAKDDDHGRRRSTTSRASSPSRRPTCRSPTSGTA